MPWFPLSPALQQAYAQAVSHHGAGRFREAEMLYRQVLAQQPDHADALHGLGLLALSAGHPADAAALIEKAIQIDPDAGIYHANLGLACRALGKPLEELAAYKRAADLSPNVPEAHYNLGIALIGQGELEQAIAAYGRALGLRPDFPEARNALGSALRDQGRLDEAAVECRRAVELRPNFPEAYNTLGCALMDLNRLPEAIEALRRAIALHPGYPEALSNLGNTLRMAGRLDEAVAALRQSLAVRPGDANALWNLSLVLLLQDHSAEGWAAYESRRALRARFIHYNFPQPQWTGGNVAGKRILLHAEQGFGDTIQMARYARLLADRGAHVYLECQPPLRRLLQGADGVERVIARGDELPPFDLHCPVMSLPGRFGTTTATIPNPIPYLRVDPQALEAWRKKLQTEDRRLKVGLVWSGRRFPPNRSIPPELLLPLAKIQGVRFYNLQPRESATLPAALPTELGAVDCSADLLDFVDTAAAMSQLDLTITIDTAAAHLAGALGRPAWVLLQFACDWRWFADRPDSPWYPTLHLFRQPAPGDWENPLRQIAMKLAGLAHQSRNQLGLARIIQDSPRRH